MNTYRTLALVLILAMMAFVSGCTTTSFKNNQGVEFSRTSFLNKQTIKEVTLKDGSISVKGYSTDPNVEAANAIAQAVATAVSDAFAKQAAK